MAQSLKIKTRKILTGSSSIQEAVENLLEDNSAPNKGNLKEARGSNTVTPRDVSNIQAEEFVYILKEFLMNLENTTNQYKKIIRSILKNERVYHSMDISALDLLNNNTNKVIEFTELLNNVSSQYGDIAAKTRLEIKKAPKTIK
jgi:hypothetical protein